MHQKQIRLLQVSVFKNWFSKRYSTKSLEHYQQTAAQIQSDMHIEEMFNKLDEDGGGTLSIEEITSLFKENGIHMREAEVANMFANAQRMHLV